MRRTSGWPIYDKEKLKQLLGWYKAVDETDRKSFNFLSVVVLPKGIFKFPVVLGGVV